MYEKTYAIEYHELNPKKQAGLIAVLNYLQSIAIEHSEAVNLGLERLAKEHRAWLLVRWHLEMERYPKWNEPVKIRTAAISHRVSTATRVFEIDAPDGTSAGKASSIWVYMDTARRRPARVTDEVHDAYSPVLEYEVKLEKDDLPAPGREPLCTYSFRVGLRDIDTNLHVNNVSYAIWALEDIPDEIVGSREVAELDVVYKKECTRHQKVTVRFYQMDDDEKGQRVFYSEFWDEEGKVLHAKVRTAWRKPIP